VIDILDKPHDVAGQPHAKVFNRHFNRKRRRTRNRDFDVLRRREIERLAKLVGASDNHLIAWVWSNSKATDPIYSLMNAADYRMGRKVSEAEASGIYDQAMNTPKRRSADALACFLGLTYDVRTKLKIQTIGSTDVRKDDRKEMRKVIDKVRKERKRRANGVQPRSEYLLKSLSRTQPWMERGKSRRTWERHRRQEAIRLRSYFDATSVVACRNSVGGNRKYYCGHTCDTV